MIFLTMDGSHIDLTEAERIYVGWRVIDSRKCWAILVDVEGITHSLVSTGDDKQQAEFHSSALRQCQLGINNTGNYGN